MKDYKKSAEFTLVITYVLMGLLICFAVILPYGVTWYVEKMGRSADLATVVMLTCYPCTPLAFVAILSLQKIMKNVLKGNIVNENNLKCLKRLAVCCFVAGMIMAFAGSFYMPFYISGGSALFCSVVVKVVYDILGHYIKKDEE